MSAVVIGALRLQLGPLYFLIVPVAAAALVLVVVVLRHRRPRSLEANVESFNRGLRALSPESSEAKRRKRRSPVPPFPEPRPPARTVVPTRPGAQPSAGPGMSSTTPTRRPPAGSPAREADAG